MLEARMANKDHLVKEIERLSSLLVQYIKEGDIKRAKIIKQALNKHMKDNFNI